MATALSHHLQLAKGGAQSQAQTPEVTAIQSKRMPRHDFFPCVYNDTFIEVIDDPVTAGGSTSEVDDFDAAFLKS